MTIYAILVGLLILVVVFRGLVFANFTLKAAKVMHNKVFSVSRSVVGGLLMFFVDDIIGANVFF
jgi:hypothetical protein